ncbi:uncharacterized protein F4817DRAFT_363813 [Daldinia loculata]|uniref:uncharacterized protein n=1 Tax=Daldinia loculata TaxID=103429 RepID=UPI0020C484B3|nr:uncharacterized protein F4817DRAFT_363813 [Daldinia loculata]KAI1641679.1 hypothetical protein F4817DRAFT_363813 [Daldinia loculata]
MNLIQDLRVTNPVGTKLMVETLSKRQVHLDTAILPNRLFAADMTPVKLEELAEIRCPVVGVLLTFIRCMLRGYFGYEDGKPESPLTKCAWHNFGHDVETDKRVAGEFIALVYPDLLVKTWVEIETMTFTEVLSSSPIIETFFASPDFHLLNPQFRQAPPGGALRLARFSTNELVTSSKVEWNGEEDLGELLSNKAGMKCEPSGGRQHLLLGSPILIRIIYRPCSQAGMRSFEYLRRVSMSGEVMTADGIQQHELSYGLVSIVVDTTGLCKIGTYDARSGRRNKPHLSPDCVTPRTCLEDEFIARPWSTHFLLYSAIGDRKLPTDPPSAHSGTTASTALSPAAPTSVTLSEAPAPSTSQNQEASSKSARRRDKVIQSPGTKRPRIGKAVGAASSSYSVQKLLGPRTPSGGSDAYDAL